MLTVVYERFYADGELIGAVWSRDVLSAAGCAVYVDIEACAPYLTRVCVRYGIRHMQRMAVCLMYVVVRTRATYRGGVCG